MDPIDILPRFLLATHDSKRLMLPTSCYISTSDYYFSTLQSRMRKGKIASPLLVIVLSRDSGDLCEPQSINHKYYTPWNPVLGVHGQPPSPRRSHRSYCPRLECGREWHSAGSTIRWSPIKLGPRIALYYGPIVGRCGSTGSRELTRRKLVVSHGHLCSTEKKPLSLTRRTRCCSRRHLSETSRAQQEARVHHSDRSLLTVCQDARLGGHRHRGAVWSESRLWSGGMV